MLWVGVELRVAAAKMGSGIELAEGLLSTLCRSERCVRLDMVVGAHGCDDATLSGLHPV